MVSLGSGQGVAQLAQLAFIPVLTRFYTPAQYGAFAVFSLLSTTAMVLCTWRYELAIVLAEDDEGGRDLFALVALLALACSGAAFALLTWAGGGEGLFGYSWSPATSALLAAAMLLQALYAAMGYWLLRMKAFRAEARGRIILAVGVGISQVVAVSLSEWTNGLIVGFVAGYGLAVAGLARGVAAGTGAVPGRVRFSGMFAMARRFQRFPRISTWEAFAGRAVLLLPPALLTYFFGASVAGLFALARNVYNIPLSLVSEPASRVFMVKARESVADARALRRLCRSWLWRLALLGAVGLGALAWLAPGVFGAVFGNQWAEAGPYMLALLPITFARFVVVPVMPVLIVLERQGESLSWQLGLAALALVGYTLLSLVVEPFFVVAGAGLACAIWYAGLVVVVLRILMASELASRRPVGPQP